MLKKLFVFTLAGSLLTMTSISTAQEDPVITYRQKVMQSIGANTGAVSDVLKHSLPYRQNIEVHAKQVNRAASLVPSAFEENVSEGLTDAKPAIWEEWKEFKEYAGDLESESAALAEIAADSDAATVAAQMKKVGEACEQCHDEFRKPEEESYKKQM